LIPVGKWLTVLVLGGLGLSCSEKPQPVAPAVTESQHGIPELTVRRMESGKIKVDGELAEPEWDQAMSTGSFVSPGDGQPVPGSPVAASARMGWNEDLWFVALRVSDPAPASPFSPQDVDPHIWERASAVELMIQPGDPGDNRNYYEIQVDVAGAVWDTRFDDYNQPISGAGGTRRFGHQEWKSGVRRAVKISDGGYAIELAIPFGSFESPTASIPPKEGDVWRVNLYAFRDGQRHSVAWSPLRGQGNFHRAARFGRIRFVSQAQ
jgi:hypothetical protein